MASTMGKTTTVGTTIAFVSMIGVNYFQVKGYFNDRAFNFLFFTCYKPRSGLILSLETHVKARIYALCLWAYLLIFHWFKE